MRTKDPIRPRPRCIRHRLEAPTGLGEVAALLPVAPHRVAKPDRRLTVAGCDRPVENRADVVMVTLQPAEPATLIVAGEEGRETFTESDERGRVTALDLGPLAARAQLLGRKLADRFEHPEARLPVALLGSDEALVREGHQPIEHVQACKLRGGSADRLRAVELTAPGEHRQPREEDPLTLGKQLVAPGNRTAQGLLPLRQVARSRREHPQLMLESLEDRVGREQLDPGRGKLDRERHPVESSGDAGNRRSVVVRHLEIRPNADGACDEQTNGLVLGRGGRVEAPITRRQVHLLEVG